MLKPRRWRFDLDSISRILLFGILAAIFLTFRQYGISWDEPAQREVGIRALNYYTSGFEDLQSAAPDYFDRIYGGFFEMVAELAVRLFRGHPYEIRHLVNALAGFAGFWGCWRLARFMGGPLAGFLAVILLVFFPTYVGHMFNNPKDIPFAAACIWSLYFLILVFSKSGKPSFWNFLPFAAAAGITAGIRVGGLVIFGVAAVGFGVQVLLRCASPARAGALRDMLQTGLYLLASFIAAFALMLLFWPWAQQNPVSNTLYALKAFSNWNGMSGDPGYLFRCLSVKLPEILILGLACALLLVLCNIRAALASVRAGNQDSRERLAGFALLAASFLLPAAYIICKRSVLYNEMRQVIFLSLPMVVCSALAFSAVFKIRMRLARYAAAAVILGFLCLPAYSIARLYPYHYIYCNNISGGLNGLGKEFTYEYYLHSYRELALQLNDYLARSGLSRETPFKIFVHGSPKCLTSYLPENFETVGDAEQADFAAYCILHYNDTRAGREIGKVSRCGFDFSTLRAYDTR